MGPLSEQIEKLIVLTALGNRRAFHELYDATSAKLFGVCLRILRNRAEAEDALQEVYIRVWHKADSYTASRAAPMSWLAAIARNHAIDRVRARRPDPEELERRTDLSDDDPTPEEAAVASGERARLDACLAELDDAKRDAVRGAYLEGYSYKELADKHGIPLNTVRTWLRRSLMKLRECLER